MEFKSARGGVPKSLWETYSAFANTDGGVIVLGVKQRSGNRFEIQGLENAEKIRQDFWNNVNNKAHVSHNLLRNDCVRVVPVEGSDVLIIEVPRADRHQRPVFLGPNPLVGTYRRYHEGDYRCDDAEVRRMLSDAEEHSADSRVLSKFSMDDIHIESLQAYRNRFRSRDETHPWLNEDVSGFLRKIGGIRKDRDSGDEGLTVAGLLMFGKEEAIKDPAAGIRFQLDYRDRRSEDPSVRWVDRVWQDGTWNANLFQFFFRVYPRLTEGLKIPFGYQKEPDPQLGNAVIVRRDDTLVHEAIREAMVNCLIHADYRGQGGIVMEHHFDRLEFSDPGNLLVSFEQLIRGSVSECRNETLQTMFTLIGLGEKAGSGIDKIREGWKSVRWRLPTLSEQFQPDRVTVTMPMVSLLPDAAVQKLRGIIGDELQSLNAEEVQALVTADIEGSVSNFRLQSLTERHPSDLTKLQKNLVGRDLLERDGHGRGATYSWSERLRHGPTPSNGPEGSGATPGAVRSGPGASESTPGATEASVESGCPPGQDPALLKIASPARENKRLPPAKMQNVILSLCRDRELTGRDIAELLQRNQDRVLKSYIRPMVEKGLLKRTYPDDPNHPQQAYRSDAPDQRELFE
ncbi:RNA-binding domain-containing protein [Rhodopirellula sp. MGV]|uniref:RNA-binding domain-containing protein n=1 Tax=Rhodopirellula sp. MGV TaxID=2023130 RepID=UPI0021018123|nr:RNA-binding domain-containing protein [Rhodopirellula sp. MGV]